MIKQLFCIVAALCVSSATPVSAGEPYSFPKSAINVVFCGGGMGTAFHIGNGKYITAYHVVDGCQDNVPGLVVDVKNDFAIFDGPVIDSKVSISCKRYKGGEVYVAAGYPGESKGLLVREPIVAVDYRPEGWQAFIGRLMPGMSGGPVFNKAGKVVGIVNMQWPARSLSLNKTSLCKD